MKRAFFPAILLGLAVVSGCLFETELPEMPEAEVASPAGSADEPAPVEPLEEPARPLDPRGEDAAKQVAISNAHFAFALYSRLAESAEGENLFFSPFSVSSVLAMTMEGARGDTLQEMATVLQYAAAESDLAAIRQLQPTIHLGMNHVGQTVNAKDDSLEQMTLRRQAETLQASLDAVRQQAHAVHQGDWNDQARQSILTLQSQEATLVGQLNPILEQIDNNEVMLANAIWGEQTYPFAPAYATAIEQYYDSGPIFPCNFKGAAERERLRINNWISSRTNQRIEDALPAGSLNPLTRLVLTNAIYFKGDWLEPFDEDATRALEFTGLDRKPFETLIMSDYKEESRYAAFNADGSYFDTPTHLPAPGGEGGPIPPMPEEAEEAPEEEEPVEVAKYPDPKGFQMLEMPYRGERLSMMILLPMDPAGLQKLEKLLSGETIFPWIQGLRNRAVRVRVPKFKMGTDYSLAESLKAMGMELAFLPPPVERNEDLDVVPVEGASQETPDTAPAEETPAETAPTEEIAKEDVAAEQPTAPEEEAPPYADFSGMSASGRPELFISDVLHKAFVEVNEKGTEAAAATISTMETAAGPGGPRMIPFTPEFYADRPFIFLIVHRPTNAILFVGRVTDPREPVVEE